MDSLVNLGKQAFSDYQQSQQQGGGNSNNNNNQQQQQHNNNNNNNDGNDNHNYQGGHNQQQGFDLGGEHMNRPPQGGNHGGGGGGGGGFDLGDISSIISNAQSHPQGQSQDSSLFSSVASFLKNKQGDIDPNDIDEDQVVQNHQKVTNSNDTATSGEIGQAAALNAIKGFLGGGNNGGGGSGNAQQQMIGAAMAAAGNLFDQKQSQGQASGLKEEAMQKAGEAVMKLMIKNQVSGMIGGGNSGGLGQLAAKFLN